MKKSSKIIVLVVAILLVIAIVAVAVMALKPKQKEPQLDVDLTSKEKVQEFIEKVYDGVTEEISTSLATNEVDINDEQSLAYSTGLASNENIEFAIVSEPQMSSQAYSFVIVRVKDQSKVKEVKQQMLDNLDYRKWICVAAERTYVTSYGNTVLLVMSNERISDAVYESMVDILGNDLGETLRKNNSI